MVRIIASDSHAPDFAECLTEIATFHEKSPNLQLLDADTPLDIILVARVELLIYLDAAPSVALKVKVRVRTLPVTTPMESILQLTILTFGSQKGILLFWV